MKVSREERLGEGPLRVEWSFARADRWLSEHLSSFAFYENSQPHQDDNQPVRLSSQESVAGAGWDFGFGAAGGTGVTAGDTDGVGAAGVMEGAGAGAGGVPAAATMCGAGGPPASGCAGDAECAGDEASEGRGVTVAVSREFPPFTSVACEMRSISPMSGGCPISLSYRSMTACMRN